MRRRSAWGLLVFGAFAAACAHPRLAPPGFNISSERSDYSPNVRLAVALPLVPAASTRDTITVVIDSAIVTAPGSISSDTAAVMSNLYITALLATRPPGGGPATGLPEPWHELAAGDSILLVDALHLGVPRSVGRLVLRVAPPMPLDPTRTWLVFRISGAASTNAVMLADGRIIARRLMPGAVRVYACADWTLAGYVDKARSRELARAYTSAC